MICLSLHLIKYTIIKVPHDKYVYYFADCCCTDVYVDYFVNYP